MIRFAFKVSVGAACLTLARCGLTAIEPEKQRPFIFNQLTLRQESPEGEPLWELRSPSSKYQIKDRVSYIKKPIGTLYDEGQPTYRIFAPEAIIIGDGDQIELIDGVTMRALDDSGQVIKAQKVVWRPSDELLVLEGNAQAFDKANEVTADKAVYYAPHHTLNLENNVVLRAWNNGINRSVKPNLIAYSKFAQWNTDNGDLTASGPISGYQQDEPGKVRILTAKELKGNAKENWLDFMAPVRIEEPVDKLLINAGKTRYWIQDKKITSNSAIDGTFKQLKVTGSRLEILQAKKQVTIGKDCKLTQPGESLEAKRCRWNWGSGAVQAIGDVVLKREELNQETRAQQLSGLTTDEGRVVFTSPGDQVRTQLEFKNPDSKRPDGQSTAPQVQF